MEKAAIMAIEALEAWRQTDPNSPAGIYRGPALTALRKALGDPEPVVCVMCKEYFDYKNEN